MNPTLDLSDLQTIVARSDQNPQDFQACPVAEFGKNLSGAMNLHPLLYGDVAEKSNHFRGYVV